MSGAPASPPGPARTSLLIATLAMLASIAAPSAPAAAAGDVVLADFERSDALAGITMPAPDLDEASLTEGFASEGKASMRFDAGAFASQGGLVFPRVWLNAGSTVPDVDWTPHTYLHVGMANSSLERIQMYVIVFGDNGRYLGRSVAADPFTYHVFQIKTTDIAAAGVDPKNIDKIQISTERSPNPKRMYIDDIRLTDQVADVPAEQARVAPALIRSMGLDKKLSTASNSLEKVRRRIKPTPSDPDKALVAQADAIEQKLDDYRDQIPSVGNDVTKARTIWFGLGDVDWEIKRLSTFVDARAARPTSPVGLGFSDSMSRVYPRDLPCDCEFKNAELNVVPGEHESIQLVAVPYGSRLSGAQVKATVTGGPSEGVSVTAHPVVSLNMAPPVAIRPATPTAFHPSLYQGWTPDPIQTGQDSVDVAAGDLQAFWVAVKTARDTRAGTYPVELTLTAEGLAPQQAHLRVRVWDAEIAPEPQLRTAIGHHPAAYAEPYGVTDPDKIAELTNQKYEFLAGYGLQGDNIYRSIYEGKPPSVESLRKIDEEYGGLRQFNIWYFDPRLFDLDAPDTWAGQADELFDLIDPYVEKYRDAGYLDEAYLYCCDETRAEHTEVITFVLNRFNERFPDIRVLTTAIDNRMGSETGLDELMDWWVRDVPWYDPDIIDARHAKGLEAWWYLHAGNRNPTPNMFVNYDPGQLRNLLGPMSHWADVDGFLYYRVDRWYGHPILDDGPLSSWDPRTWNNYAGDGSLLYPGPEGPIPSIRLENIRDGLEDYNLLEALRQAIAEAPPGTDPDLIARAKHLLDAKDVVTSNFEYVTEPAVYRAWRTKVARTVSQLT